MLVVTPLDPNATVLPSPNQLKRKIIIKHKKLTLTDGGEPTLEPSPLPSTSEPPTDHTDLASFMMDLSNSIKNGYLFMQDPIDKVGVVWSGTRFMCRGNGFADVGTAFLRVDGREVVFH